MTNNYLNEDFIDEIAKGYFSLSDADGFINHPQSAPINIQIIDQKYSTPITSGQDLGIGLSFNSKQYFSLNEHLRISLILQGKEHYFCGEVVMIKNFENHYEIGVWFSEKNIVKHLREVQQYYHVENYIREKHIASNTFTNKQLEIFLKDVFPSV